MLCDDAFIAELNRKWRQLDKPTNVLSFPSGGPVASTPVLGDIVIAYETTAKEAAEADKPLRDHVAHLMAHGFLHLIGYDHVADADAEAMEALEALRARASPGSSRLADPYAAPRRPARVVTTTMSERESPAAGEAGSDRAGAARPGLFDRLRAVFGLGGASIRDDIQDALADSSTEVDVSARKSAPCH